MYETAVCVPDSEYSVHINNIHTRNLRRVYNIQIDLFFYYLAELTSVNSQHTLLLIAPKQNSIIIKEKQKTLSLLPHLNKYFSFIEWRIFKTAG